ncbi:MAG: glycosyltransferase [Candidatus Thermoplasmatota archaeon]
MNKKTSETLDAIIVAKNSEKTLYECIKSIKDNIKVNNIIVIDGGSTDGTLDIAKSFNCKIIENIIGLGNALYTGFENASTKYVLKLDSDMKILNGYDKLFNYLGTYACVKSIPIMKMKENSNFHKYYHDVCKNTNVLAFNNVIIDRELLLKCKELKDLKSREDYFFQKWMDNNNIKYYISDDSYIEGIDYTFDDLLRSMRRTGRDINKLELIKLFLRNLDNIRKCFFRQKDLVLIKLLIVCNIEMLKSGMKN